MNNNQQKEMNDYRELFISRAEEIAKAEFKRLMSGGTASNNQSKKIVFGIDAVRDSLRANLRGAF